MLFRQFFQWAYRVWKKIDLIDVVSFLLWALLVILPITGVLMAISTFKMEDNRCREAYGPRYDHQARGTDPMTKQPIHRTVCINVDTYEEKPVR